MVRPDDSSLSTRQRRLIRQHARQALQSAQTFGVFPTPVDEIMAAAKVFVAEQKTLGLRRSLNRLQKTVTKTQLKLFKSEQQRVELARARAIIAGHPFPI